MQKIVTLLIIFTISLTGQIKNSIPNIEKGNYPVASTNLTHDDAKISQVVGAGGNVGEYWEGRVDGKKYVSELLPESSTALKFDLEFPNDAGLYGEDAGKTYTFVAVMFYPTTEGNTRSDYELPGGSILPKMQSPGESPVFAETGAKIPLIIYSHGKGSHPVGAISNIEYLASHGFAVAALFYADKRYKEFSILNMNDAQDIASRPLAASKLIDYLSEHDDYKDKLDFENVSAVGVSYGGATNLGLLGGEILGSTPPTFMPTRALKTDDRIKCAVGIVPYLGNEQIPFFGPQYAGLTQVTKPYLAIAASDDDLTPLDYMKGAFEFMKGDKYLVKINNVGHGLSDEATTDFLTWTLMFLGKYGNNETLVEYFNTTTSIDEGESDSFIPLAIPDQPQLNFPADEFKVTESEITLTWFFKNDAGYYNIQISDTDDFSNLIVNETASEGMLYTFSTLEDNKFYYWRTKAFNDYGESEYSETRKFYKGHITGINNETPDNFALLQNYPNPFNPETTINYSIPEESFVKINIYNNIGEKVQTLVNQKMEAGTYKVYFNAGNIPSGVYIYTMEADNFFDSKKMLVLK